MTDTRSPSALGRLRGEAVEGVVRLVVEGALQMETKTSEPRLAAQLGLSRTPVREALAILSAAGVVERRPQVGVWIRRVTTVELSQLLATAEGIIVPAIEVFAQTQQEDVRRARELRRSGRLLEDAVEEYARISNRRSQDDVLQAEIELLDRIMLIAGLAPAQRWYIDVVGIEQRLFHAERDLWSTAEVKQRSCASVRLVESLSRFDADSAKAAEAYLELLRNLL